MGIIIGMSNSSGGSSGGASLSTAKLMKTGQTTSYRTGDDGDLQEGRATDFLTLAENNPFGDTYRFTDELGGQTFTNDIVIDWSTYDGATVLGWYKGDSATARVWDDAIDVCLTYSLGIFTTGWRLPNANEYSSIVNWGLTSLLNYAPFNYALGLISSTSNTSLKAVLYVPQTPTIQSANKSSSYRHFAVRTFTVTGTTLS